MNITLEQMAEKLKEYDEFCLVYHIRPDGDAIASAYALCLALRSLGKKCAVEATDPVPKKHRHLTDVIEQDTLNEPIYCAVDSGAPVRVGTYADKHFTLCIDHHKNNSIIADFKYVEEDCGACAEIIFKLIKLLDIDMTKQMADLIYTGIVTDTNCFRTSDTNVQTFEIAAQLAKAGADIFDIGRRNTFIKSKGRAMIEDMLRKSFHFSCEDRLLTGIITLDNLKTANILDSELEGINAFAEQIEGVRIAVTVRELPSGNTRCSVRTNGDIAANEICALHGGGGHLHAASCELSTNPDNARVIIEETCKKFL